MSESAGQPDDAGSDEPPSGPTGAPVLTRLLGFPPAVALAPVPLGAFACSLLFDLVARVDSSPCSDFIYPSFLLHVVGVVSGLVVVTLALPDLRRRRDVASGFGTGVRQLLLCDAALLCFGISAYVRHDRDPCVDAPVAALVLSSAGAVLLGAVVVQVLRAVFGAHVAHEAS